MDERTGSEPGEPPSEPSGETLKQWLHDMLLIREFEVRCMQAYQNRFIGGFCHVCIGQEAVAVGSMAAIRDDDPVITAYRDHGHALARGMDPRHCMAELFGRLGGCARGKGGSMHFFDRSRHFYGGHGIVGSQIPLGAGLAFATRYEDEVLGDDPSSRVTLCFFGDGALNQGSFHEAMNLAGLWNLPVIFICENNGYSMGTSIARGTTMAHDLSVKAAAYGIRHVAIDGMDVIAVHRALAPLVAWCRDEVRPAFVDMRTYRYKGHSMSDPRKYRSREEEEAAEDEDPIDRLATHLEERGILSSGDVTSLTKEIKARIREAVAWGKASPKPGPEELYTDVYLAPWGPYAGSTPRGMPRDEEDAS